MLLYQRLPSLSSPTHAFSASLEGSILFQSESSLSNGSWLLLLAFFALRHFQMLVQSAYLSLIQNWCWLYLDFSIYGPLCLPKSSQPSYVFPLYLILFRGLPKLCSFLWHFSGLGISILSVQYDAKKSLKSLGSDGHALECCLPGRCLTFGWFLFPSSSNSSSVKWGC